VRLDGLNPGKLKEDEMFCKVELFTTTEQRNLEKALHEMFSRQHSFGEFFWLTAGDISNARFLAIHYYYKPFS
jgi:hypothetical protein